MSFAGLLNTTAKVIRFTTSQGTMGGAKETPTTIINSLPCRIEALSGTERSMRGSTGVYVTHRMFCLPPADVEIAESDEIEIGSTRYEIMFVDNLQGHHLEIELAERRHEG